MQNNSLPAHAPLAVTYRGTHVENVYYGSYAVVDAHGHLIDHAGDADAPMFTRSSLKPFQALALIAHADVGQFNLEPADIALMCSSHNGEPTHAARAQALLARIGADASAYQCGTHAPYWYRATGTPVPSGHTWSCFQHNCSGKHAGFLLLSHLLGANAGDYLAASSQVQTQVRAAVAYAAGLGDDVAAMPWGTDGCSAPNFALSVTQLARAFAWLAAPTADARYGSARSTIFNAMAAHPEMVSGEARNDLHLTRAGGGDWVNKMGAEGVQTLASRKHGKAIALKSSCGNDTAVMLSFLAVMKKHGMLDAAAALSLQQWSDVRIKSIAGAEVGRWESCIA